MEIEELKREIIVSKELIKELSKQIQPKRKEVAVLCHERLNYMDLVQMCGGFDRDDENEFLRRKGQLYAKLNQCNDIINKKNEDCDKLFEQFARIKANLARKELKLKMVKEQVKKDKREKYLKKLFEGL